MRLIDLSPVWLIDNGQRVGFTFISPTDPKWRQSCFVVCIMRREQWRLFKETHETEYPNVQNCNSECQWVVAGGIDDATFETMTVTPSLDGSAGGLWHGHITNGEIVGGI